jgi:hypothetical protein
MKIKYYNLLVVFIKLNFHFKKFIEQKNLKFEI